MLGLIKRELEGGRKRRKDNKKNTTHFQWKVNREYGREMSCQEVGIC